MNGSFIIHRYEKFLARRPLAPWQQYVRWIRLRHEFNDQGIGL